MTRRALVPALALMTFGLSACLGPKPTTVGSDEAPARIIPARELPTEGCVRKRRPSTGRMEWICPEHP